MAGHTRWPRHTRWPAFVAGIIFTFAPVHIAHLLGHLQVMSVEWIPFYALYLLRIVTPQPQHGAEATVLKKRSPAGADTDTPLTSQSARTLSSQPGGLQPRAALPASPHGTGTRSASQSRPWHNILLAALFLVLVALCDWYFVMYCAVLTAVLLAWRAWAGVTTRAPLTARLRAFGRTTLHVAAAWLIFVAVLSPLLAPMVQDASRLRFMVPDPGQSRLLSADLLAFVTPQEFHPLWGRWAQGLTKAFTSGISEHTVFAGYAALLLAGVGLWAQRWGSSRTAAGRPGSRPRAHTTWGPWPLALVVFFVLTLGRPFTSTVRLRCCPAAARSRCLTGGYRPTCRLWT